ncbi:MAG TPA: class I SAM-dependent methyltransferase [Roseiflexaceae bacterium]|nr:class I SAM-dependent methyltransferase [Roseiflexaceae bacterium]
MLHTLLDRLAASPQLWGLLRWLAEGGFHADREVITRELAPHQAVGSRTFLDFGCGTGEFAPLFPAGSYIGFDIARHYVRHAAYRHHGHYAVMSGGELAYRDQQFDAALVLGVFHHMPDALVRSSIAELYRVLRPGARLLIMEDVPSPRRWNLAGHFMHWLDRGDHIRSDAEYRALFEPYFTISRSYPIQSGVCDLAVYVTARAALRPAGAPTMRHGIQPYA